MLSTVRLQRFRSYREREFELAPGVNIIVGPNASGKTNLLEAVYVASVGSSFRAKDNELIAHGAPWARIDVTIAEESRTVKLMSQPGGLIKKEFLIAGRTFQRLSFQKMIPVVLFEPNHLLLLHGTPDKRREYMDDLLQQTVPGYGVTRRSYRRVLAQRNALLKQGAQIAAQLFAWNIRLSELGAQLVTSRLKLIEGFNARLSTLYHELAYSRLTEVTAEYISAFPAEHYASALLGALEQRERVDFERGFTTVGPHRDDLRVTLNGRAAEDTASRGEMRTVLLALKVLELALIEDVHGVRPLLLLDDVFSELDTSRRQALTELLRTYQTIITTTDADAITGHFKGKSHVIRLA